MTIRERQADIVLNDIIEYEFPKKQILNLKNY